MKIERLTSNWNPIGVYITSGSGEDDKPDCELVLLLYWCWIRIGLPQLIQPAMRKIKPNWDADTVARLGRNYYIDYTRRDYGFQYSGGFLSVFFGRQSNDSSTEQRWSCFLPWTQWRFVRHSFYGLEGEHRWTQFEKNRKRGCMDAYEEMRAAEEATPKVIFLFKDFDGEEIQATTHIEEREWHFGEGWFRWLSLFRATKIRRSLAIQFSKETGRSKGSWKGGTMGHGIDMQTGETHAQAFWRYCKEHEMTFIGWA